MPVIIPAPRWIPIFGCCNCPYRGVPIMYQKTPICTMCGYRVIPDESLEGGFPEWCPLDTASDVAKREAGA